MIEHGEELRNGETSGCQQDVCRFKTPKISAKSLPFAAFAVLFLPGLPGKVWQAAKYAGQIQPGWRPPSKNLMKRLQG